MRRVVVIGAGAAGTMAAIFAATAGAETVLLERTRDGGRKILISGGGRCNVLPSQLDETRFVTRHLFGDAEGIEAARRIDRHVDRLPGLEGLRLCGRVAAA